MRDANGLDHESPHSDLVARPIGPEIRARQRAQLGQPVAGDGQGERGAVHGHVELPQEIGEGADVVLVPVRQDHGAKAVTLLAEIRPVRDDVVDPGHLVVGKEQAAVHGDDVVARLHEHHVEPDLAQPAQRNQADGRLGGHIDRDG